MLEPQPLSRAEAAAALHTLPVFVFLFVCLLIMSLLSLATALLVSQEYWSVSPPVCCQCSLSKAPLALRWALLFPVFRTLLVLGECVQAQQPGRSLRP